MNQVVLISKGPSPYVAICYLTLMYLEHPTFEIRVCDDSLLHNQSPSRLKPGMFRFCCLLWHYLSVCSPARQRGNPDEAISNPYRDEDIFAGCLVLNAEGYVRIHLIANLSPSYPLTAPGMRMDSKVAHPDVKAAGHVCASISDTKWTMHQRMS